MKENWQKLKEWWSTLGAREKKGLSAALVAIPFLIIYQFIWSPTQEAASQLRARISGNEKTLAWMQSADKEMQKRASKSMPQQKITSLVILLGLLQKEIEKASLQPNLTLLKQGNNNSIEMHFQKIPFDALIKLLLQTSKEHGIEIVQMAAMAESASGLVSADILIKLA